MAGKSNIKEILVFFDRDGKGGFFFMGTLLAERVRGREIFSFRYSEEWIRRGDSQLMDPDLQFFRGPQYLKDEKPNFGVFLDSAPDRWGRLLMRRKEANLARKEKRQERQLMESDYLLGVFDEYRMGALRFRDEPEGPFLNNDDKDTIPPWSSLKELEEISLKLEDDDARDDPEYTRWIEMLIAPGSSLGGSRPKAGITDKKNNLWIAKFPGRHDLTDIGAWEMVVHDLAVKAGLNTAEALLEKFSGKHHTFMTKRFDRAGSGSRLHFASAMTMLGYSFGKDFHEGVSYLEMADFISTYGAKVENDLEELWRRIVFSICVSNIDDHLRNHGFILSDAGWLLSPAFDINPVESGAGLSLNISHDDNSLDFNLAMSVSGYFRLTGKRASEIVDHVKSSVRSWEKIAGQYTIPGTETDIMAGAFRMADE
ncbi:MAG: toxin HipA [Bacteroidetes bacterium RBG_13_44_24]|nr:MAG: toxin HipA [Bacteroidetes bacterium RBG_13_44_24]